MARCRSGNRRNSEGNTIRSSARARLWPRQTWLPWPKATCGTLSRVGSNSSGSGPHPRVAVGPGFRDDHEVAALDGDVADLDVLHRPPQQSEVVRRGQASDLLDDRVDPALGILHEPVLPLRLVQEVEHTEVHAGHGGLVAGEDEPGRVTGERLVEKRFGSSCSAATMSEITSGPGFARLTSARRAMYSRAPSSRDGVGLVADRAHAVGELEAVVAVLGGTPSNAQITSTGSPQPTCWWKSTGVVGIGVVRGLHRVEAAVGELLDPFVEQLDALGRERRHQQLAQLDLVLAVLGVAHRLAQHDRVGRQRRVRRIGVDVVAEALVGEREAGLLVPDDQPSGIADRRGDAHDGPLLLDAARGTAARGGARRDGRRAAAVRPGSRSSVWVMVVSPSIPSIGFLAA